MAEDSEDTAWWTTRRIAAVAVLSLYFISTGTHTFESGAELAGYVAGSVMGGVLVTFAGVFIWKAGSRAYGRLTSAGGS